jgi:hypothetical protein
MRAVIALLLLLSAASGMRGDQDLIAAVAARLSQPIAKVEITDATEAAQTVATILARPDPETFFSRYVFGLQGAGAHLLEPAQLEALKALVARYAPLRTRWHDERNTLRCKFNEVMWRYAGADESAAATLRAELARWMELRMEWTLREQLLYHELDAAAWALLHPAQRQHILAGDWKIHVKLTTGHQRENATTRLILKALGPPDRSAEFEQAAAYWNGERKPLHHILLQAEHTARRVGFAMDLNSAALVAKVTVDANDAYARLYLAEADAYRRLVQSGFDDPAAACAKAAVVAWQEAPQRFTAGAADMIRLLSPSGN